MHNNERASARVYTLVYSYTCMRAYVCTYIRTHIYTRACTHIHTHTHINIHTYIHTCIFGRRFTRVNYGHTYNIITCSYDINSHVHIRVHTRALYVYVTITHAHAYVSTGMRVYAQRRDVYIFKYIILMLIYDYISHYKFCCKEIVNIS